MQIYTVVIKLPGSCSKHSEGTSIKMFNEDMSVELHKIMEDTDDDEVVVGGSGVGGGSGVVVVGASKVSRPGGASPSSVMRRPSQMPDIRIPLNAKSIPKVDKAILNKQPNKKKTEKKTEKKAAKTLMAILLAFIVTWTPYNILVLVKSIFKHNQYIPRELWDMSYYLCYINSTVNPMCYALCNAAFRRTYVRILKCKWHSRHRGAVDRGY